MSDQPPEGYAELEKAAELANVSTKTIRNWTAQKRIGKRKWGKKVVYRIDDIRTELAKSAEMTIAQNPAGVPMVASVGTSIAAAVADQFSRLLPASPDGVPLAEKPRVTLREAVALGFQADDLRARVKAGTLENVGAGTAKHAHYRFRRRDLDAL